MLDLALQREESFKGFESSPVNPQIQLVRENLVYLMAVLLDKQLKDPATHHRTLVKRLSKEGQLSSTTFVSSNYDILIDNALVDAYPNFDLAYGVDFTNFVKGGDWSRPRPGREVFLYKIHGSLNWLYCPACISLTLTPKEKSVAKLVFDPVQCHHCKTSMTPIVVPPTYFKDVSNLFLQEVWLSAGKAIRDADRLFFCGYSFPDADVLVKYLFKRGEMDQGRTPRIFVVNGSKDWDTGDASQEASRYRRFFKEPGDVHLTQSSFEKFCASGIDE